MSKWREIWKESLFANSKYFFNRSEGEKEFNELFKKYGSDEGMIHYAYGEALLSKNEFEKAKEEFIKAMHWIRRNGNEATHNISGVKKISELNEEELKIEVKKLKSFYIVIKYLNNMKKSKL